MSEDKVMNLKRTIQEWRNLDPVNIAQRQGRPVAKHALVDAKHDILALAARVEELEDRQQIEHAPLSVSASPALLELEVGVDKMRAEFEAWWEGKHGNRLYCQSAWRGWQASRAALVVELPERISKESGYSEDDEYYNLALKHCQHQIEAAGVRVKP